MTRIHHLLPTLLLVSAGLCAARPVAAETNDRAHGGPPARPFFLQLRYTPSELFRADFTDAPGRVTVLHHDVSGTLMIPLPDRGRINLSASRERHEYRFRNNEQLTTFMEEAHETHIGATYMGRLNEQWSVFTMGGLRWTAEEGASRSDARTQSGMFLLQHRWREDVQVGFGALAASRLDEDPLIIPTASIDWTISDRWRLRTTRGVHLLHQLDAAGKWEAGLNAEYHSRYVRLKEEGIAPGGVFRSRLVVTSLSLMVRPNPGVSFGAEVGFVPWRKITVKDADENTVFESEIDAGFSAAFTASMTF